MKWEPHTILVNVRFCSRHLFVTRSRHMVYGFPTLSISVERNRYWSGYLFRHGNWFEVYRFFGWHSPHHWDAKGRHT